MMPLRTWEMGQKELKDNIEGHVLMEEVLDRLFMKLTALTIFLIILMVHYLVFNKWGC